MGVSQATAQVVAAGYAGAISGSFNAAAAGGDADDILRGAAVGAASGAITTGVLHPLGASSGDYLTGSFYGDRALNIAGHGVVGGASSAAMGGKFQDGFLSGAVYAAGAVAGLYNTPLRGNAGMVSRRDFNTGEAFAHPLFEAKRVHIGVGGESIPTERNRFQIDTYFSLKGDI